MTDHMAGFQTYLDDILLFSEHFDDVRIRRVPGGLYVRSLGIGRTFVRLGAENGLDHPLQKSAYDMLQLSQNLIDALRMLSKACRSA